MASLGRGPPPNLAFASPPHDIRRFAGMPVALNGTTAAVGDASGVHVLEWTEGGWDVTRRSTASVQGPLRAEGGWLTGSINAPDGGFFAFALTSESADVAFSTDLRGYGTAPPVMCGEGWLLVKDAGRVECRATTHRALC